MSLFFHVDYEVGRFNLEGYSCYVVSVSIRVIKDRGQPYLFGMKNENKDLFCCQKKLTVPFNVSD